MSFPKGGVAGEGRVAKGMRACLLAYRVGRKCRKSRRP